VGEEVGGGQWDIRNRGEKKFIQSGLTNNIWISRGHITEGIMSKDSRRKKQDKRGKKRTWRPLRKDTSSDQK